MLKQSISVYLYLLLSVPLLSGQETPQTLYQFTGQENVCEVLSAVSVGFNAQIHKDCVYLGFYAPDHSMVIGKKSLKENHWEFKTLPTKIGWDSHNYITMVFDNNDYLHVAGNMHACPLIYFRAEKPDDIQSLVQRDRMTGNREKLMTYPCFLFDKEHHLIFTYRDGVSGNGSQIWNIYSEETQSWSPLLDQPMFDGENLRNAYFLSPKQGPDGYFHICWVWRDTPDCATNHDISYARSPDLRSWEDSSGNPIELPITLAKGEIVDPVPVGGGILNSLQSLSFDNQGQVILSYTKYDENGHIQIWNARREKDGWHRVQASDFDLDWHFSGGGSIINELQLSGVGVDGQKNLVQSWKMPLRHQSGKWYLDKVTLKPTQDFVKPDKPEIPQFNKEEEQKINAIEHADDRMQARSMYVPHADELMIFRWETLPSNRDHKTEGEIPDPAQLRILKFKQNRQ